MKMVLNRSGVMSLFIAAIVFSAGPVQAASRTWYSAGGRTNWNLTEFNWDGGVAQFANGDDVLFNEAGGGTIIIDPNMSPNSTTVNSSGTYTFNGGPIASGMLIKTNSGTLYLAAANTFTGAVILAGGTLQFNNGGNQTGSGPMTIMGGTTLYNQGNNWTTLYNSLYTINGSFSIGSGANNYINLATGNAILNGS